MYDSSLRRERARARRAAILDACRAELALSGYAGLTVRAVAERASVSQETVYKAFGGKRELVKTLYDVTLAGDDEPVPMADRPEVRDLLGATDPAVTVAGYARLARRISERVGVIVAALSAGGAEAAAIIGETEAERLVGVTAFVRHVESAGRLGAGVDPVAAAEACWVLTAPEVYRLCTAVRGWTGDAYEVWLTRMLTAVVLGP
ncbi:TetR family transcriptional regulator [Virgisporangium aurantiacum]|uniref:TetR family transcriptional regulator n=1 Tax=Virgisporangium aurantiacum TaxID=175570 RepID=A0A8J3Z5P2_9ACTN|nr:TetR family transcriptional regulator [Virgisporangium aurantiacum]